MNRAHGPQTQAYSSIERLGLWTLAAVGLVGLNGAFVYGLVARPGSLQAALRNPVALAFIVESLVLVGVLAWLLRRWGVSRVHWLWFVALSLLGGIAFALPVVVLAGRERGDARPPGAAASR